MTVFVNTIIPFHPTSLIRPTNLPSQSLYYNLRKASETKMLMDLIQAIDIQITAQVSLKIF